MGEATNRENGVIRRLIDRLSTMNPLIGRKDMVSAAILVPLIVNGEECRLLFQKRAAGIVQGSEICFPGGVFDPGKDADLGKTAIRETIEELGIDRSRIHIIGNMGTLVMLRGIAVDCFPALLDLPSLGEIRTGTDEVERVFTLPLTWFFRNPPEVYTLRMEMHPSIMTGTDESVSSFPARELGLPEKYWNSWQSGTRKILVYRTPEGPVWGMTASVVEELVSLTVETE